MMSPKPASRAVALVHLADYAALTKPRLVSLVLFATGIGFVLASTGTVDGRALLNVLIGTALVAGGGAALNQYLERDADALMRRTADRPLPAHRLDANDAMVFGGILVVAGLIHLGVFCNLLTMVLGVVSSMLYVFAYTPLKRSTPWSVLVGAIVGALPPVMGWTAASGRIGMGAAYIFAILFFWQLPHFLAIAWQYRDDYRRASFALAHLADETAAGTEVRFAALVLLLTGVTLMPVVQGYVGMPFLIAAVVLGLAFLMSAASISGSGRLGDGRAAFLMSLVHLPLVLIAMLFDRLLKM